MSQRACNIRRIFINVTLLMFVISGLVMNIANISGWPCKFRARNCRKESEENPGALITICYGRNASRVSGRTRLEVPRSSLGFDLNR
jgi:hypothetical protein